MMWTVSLLVDGSYVGVVDKHPRAHGETVRGVTTTYSSLDMPTDYDWEVRRLIHPDGLWWLRGKTGRETIGPLWAAIDRLGIKPYEPDLVATDGNVGLALWALWCWADQHPTGVWGVMLR